MRPLTDRIPGRLADRSFSTVTLLAGLVVLAILAYIVVSTTHYALPAFRKEGVHFLTGTTWSSATNDYGALALIYGTVVSSAIAIVLAVPIAVGVALFITELAPYRLRKGFVALVDLLAAVPSVVFGVVGLLYFRAPLERLYRHVGGPYANGSSFVTAGMVLAFMILPIVTSVTREVFAAVPAADKDAALALGATRWEMFRAAVFPYSYSGVTGAVMLGLGRALGETIAVALVIGSNAQITANLFKPGDSMAGITANTFFSESTGLNQRALIGLGVVLFAITTAINVVARLVVHRSERRMRGATA